jgi:hypothetical protein
MNTKMLIAAAALAAAVASPALAQSGDQHRQHSSNPAFDVYDNGRYVGSDPDPNIRLQMQRGHGPAGEW